MNYQLLHTFGISCAALYLFVAVFCIIKDIVWCYKKKDWSLFLLDVFGNLTWLLWAILELNERRYYRKLDEEIARETAKAKTTIRDGYLTQEEADKYSEIRENVEKEFPPQPTNSST